MDIVVLVLVFLMVVVLVMRVLYSRFRPHVEIIDLGGCVRVILYYVSLDGKIRKKVIIY